MREWYSAVLIMAAYVGEDASRQALLDHKVHLLRASNPEEAFDLALALGRDEEHEYANDRGDVVRWRFVGLADLDVLVDQDVRHGVEVFSWRSEQEPVAAIVPKERLTVFWAAANANRPAREILDEGSDEEKG